MKMERVIFVFEKNEDTLVKEITANSLTVEIIKGLFKAKENDPNFYSPNKIEKMQYDNLIIYVPELEKYPHEKYELYLEAVTL